MNDVVGSSDPLQDDADLLEAGVDSLAAVEFRRTLATHVTVPLAPLLVFEHPTIASISAHINSIMPAATRTPQAGPPRTQENSETA